MDQVEYRIEQINANGSGSIEAQVLQRLNELGRDGWHVRSVDLTGHPSFANRRIPGLLERRAMSPQVEYRIEEVTFGDSGSPEAQLLQKLSELGREGWRVVSLDLTEHPSFARRRLPILLEREIVGTARAG